MKKKIVSALRAAKFIDSVGSKQNGDIIARRGFFYRNGKSSETFDAHVRNLLEQAGLSDKYHIVESGEIWKPFRGGASTANSSHWFTVIREIV